MEYLAVFSLLFNLTLSSAAPLIFAALGGMLNENSGVTNIGLEGLMTAGAWTGVVVALFTKNPWLAFICAGSASLLFAAVYAVSTVYLHADQIVSGIAVNFLAPGFAIFLNRLIFNGSVSSPPLMLEYKMPRPFARFFENGSSGILSNFINFYSVVYLAIFSAVGIWYILYHTRLGLRIRAAGEHPQAADTVGINVYRIRFCCLLASGFLAGLGGACITLAVVSGFRPSVISGQGFIALAAVILGQWNPAGVVAGCLLFGFFKALAVFLDSPSVNLQVSPHLWATLPYVSSLLVLIFASKRSRSPASLGKPYVRN